MSARNLCTPVYWNNVRRYERSQEKEEPYASFDSVDAKECPDTSPASAASSNSNAARRSKEAHPSEEVSTIAASNDGLSEWSSTNSEVPSTSTLKVRTRPHDEDFSWNDIRLGHRLQPYRQYAHCADDIHVLAAFLELADVDDVNGDCVKILLRAMKLLHLCDYSAEDICSTLAHASYYFLETFSICGKNMDLSEIGHVLVCLIFIAHVYVQDETCPLHVWHQHLFRKYCPLRTLNAAVMRLLHLRDHMLRLPDKDLSDRYMMLMQASRTWSSRLTAAGAFCNNFDGGHSVPTLVPGTN